jgi:HSP20 family molecular chaperone IbpA
MPNDLLNMLIGFDPYFRNTKGYDNYPPYNIYEDGDKYRLEIAVAGFSKKDL